MESADLVKLIGGGGLSAALLWIIYKIATESVRSFITEQVKAMDRTVAAVERIGVKLDDHTTAEVAHHNDVRDAVVRLEGKIDGANDERARSGLTPIEGVPHYSPRAQSEPGIYGVKKNRP